VVLTNAEIIEITGKSRYRAQAMALARMGVPYLIRPDGRPIVSRIAFERVVGDDDARQIEEVSPNFGALDAASTKH